MSRLVFGDFLADPSDTDGASQDLLSLRQQAFGYPCQFPLSRLRPADVANSFSAFASKLKEVAPNALNSSASAKAAVSVWRRRRLDSPPSLPIPTALITTGPRIATPRGVTQATGNLAVSGLGARSLFGEHGVSWTMLEHSSQSASLSDCDRSEIEGGRSRRYSYSPHHFSLVSF